MCALLYAVARVCVCVCVCVFAIADLQDASFLLLFAGDASVNDRLCKRKKVFGR